MDTKPENNSNKSHKTFAQLTLIFICEELQTWTYQASRLKLDLYCEQHDPTY